MTDYGKWPDYPIAWSEEHDEGKHDSEIADLIVCTHSQLFELPGYQTFAKSWLAEQRDPAHLGDDIAIQQQQEHAWRNEIGRRNDTLRRAHVRRRRDRLAFLAAHPRHAPLVLSDEIEPTNAATALDGFASDASQSIAVLSGPPGTGKTTEAARWGWKRVLAGSRFPRWITAAAFARSSRYNAERAELLSEDALVLDDLGSEDERTSLLSDIDELVNEFYSRKARLLITTNLGGRTFQERYGARVTDRLAEAGVWIPITGPSRRRAKELKAV